MYCKSCGTNVNDGADFCPVCGAKMESAAPGTPAVVVEEEKAQAKSCMIWGIVAAALSELGLIGLIFAIIARSKVKKYINAGYQMNGMAKAGKITSLVALIVSICMTVFWLFYILVFVFILGVLGSM